MSTMTRLGNKEKKASVLGRYVLFPFLCITCKLSMFYFLLATYWIASPRDLLRNQGKKNTRFHLIPRSLESYSVKNTYWKKSTAVQKFQVKFFFFFFFPCGIDPLIIFSPCVCSNSANQVALMQPMHHDSNFRCTKQINTQTKTKKCKYNIIIANNIIILYPLLLI